jgi:hypothetical protein
MTRRTLPIAVGAVTVDPRGIGQALTRMAGQFDDLYHGEGAEQPPMPETVDSAACIATIAPVDHALYLARIKRIVADFKPVVMYGAEVGVGGARAGMAIYRLSVEPVVGPVATLVEGGYGWVTPAAGPVVIPINLTEPLYSDHRYLMAHVYPVSPPAFVVGKNLLGAQGTPTSFVVLNVRETTGFPKRIVMTAAGAVSVVIWGGLSAVHPFIPTSTVRCSDIY